MAEPRASKPGDDAAKRLEDAVTKAARSQQHAKEVAKSLSTPAPAAPPSGGGPAKP